MNVTRLERFNNLNNAELNYAGDTVRYTNDSTLETRSKATTKVKM